MSTSTENDWKNPLPGVPDIESPFFDDLFSRKPLNNDWFATALSLRDNGYAVIDFPEPDFDRLADHLITDLYPKFDWEPWKKGKNFSPRIQDAWQFNPIVQQIAANQTILSLLEYLYGRKAWPFQTLNFPVGTQQHFHSDSLHFSSIPERFMCGVWVALEDIYDDNGPLEYYPGSHKLPIYTNEHVRHLAKDPAKTGQQTYEPMWQELVRVNGLERKTFKAKKGQALIWAANLLHGGAPHINTEKTRWSQVTHYYFDDCAYFTPMRSDPTIGRILFRDMTNIETGASVKNSYVGMEVPQDFIKATRPRKLGKPIVPENFDEVAYLSANPDVRDAGHDAKSHYIKYGWAEGRKLRE